MNSKTANLLLKLLIVVLEQFSSITRLLYTTWYHLTARARPARAGGSNPPPPAVIGVILAEPDTAAMSLHRAASVAAWCLAYASVQQVHLYEPSGHLKQTRALLEGSLAELAQQQGRSIAVQCGWTVPTSSSSSSSQDKGQQSQQRASRQISSQINTYEVAAAAAAATAGIRDLAGSTPTSSNSADTGQAGSGSASTAHASSANIGQGAVATVRLLSAEDAFLPVMDAVAQRCSAFAVHGGSPRAAEAAAKSQQQQQQLQACANCVCAKPAAVGVCNCSCGQQRTSNVAGSSCTACHQQQASSCKALQQQQQEQKQQQQQQQQQRGSMLPELAAVTGSSEMAAEPQLLLVFGPALTLAGFPPYHARSAEVVHMGPLMQASQQGVADAVAAYCNVLQRHGA